MADQKNKEKPSSERFQEILDELTLDQIRFIVARQQFGTDKAAAEDIDIKPQTVYDWKSNGVPINEAVRLMALDGLVVAQEVRKKSLAKAMMVKVAGLDSEDEKLRQGVATEIIEWEMGKATQRVGGEGDSGEIVVRFAGNVKPDEL